MTALSMAAVYLAEERVEIQNKESHNLKMFEQMQEGVMLVNVKSKELIFASRPIFDIFKPIQAISSVDGK